MNKWWNQYKEEYYWVEVTSRDDIGENLKSPQKNTSGKDYWGYSILKEMYPGDGVIHYDLNTRSIVGVSEVSERWKENITTWVPSNKKNLRGVGRPGFLVDLRDYRNIRPVKLEQIQKKHQQVKNIINNLEERFKTSYFPFHLTSEERNYVSTNEGYAFIVTQDFADLFPSLKKALENKNKSQENKKQIERKSETKSKRSRGYKVDPVKNEAIELHAVRKAIEFYEDKGYLVDEKPRKNFPYDLEAKKGDTELHIEVKGKSIDDPESIDLTYNEVKHSIDNPSSSVLLIVHGIKVTPTKNANKFRTSGGKIIERNPWMIDQAKLTPRNYKYKL